MLAIRNFIDGEFHDAVSGERFDKINPATATATASVPDSDARDAEPAVTPLAAPFPSGRACPWPSATRLLFALANRIDEGLEELASPKPRIRANHSAIRASSRSRGRRPTSASSPRPSDFHSEAYRTDQLALNYTLRQPRGVAGLSVAVEPAALPVHLEGGPGAGDRQHRGRQAVGTDADDRPSAHGICQEVGLPPGVFNVVHGYGNKVGAALVAHPAVPTISFTGGTAIGAEIARTAAPLFKKLTLELGGKNPNIIFADADLDEVLHDQPARRLRQPGRNLPVRLAHLRRGERLSRALSRSSPRRRERLKVGDPLDPTVDQGALISQRHLDRVLSYIRLAKEEGGRVLCGGGPPDPQCWATMQGRRFLEPAVIVDLDINCRVNQEEIFGPVVTITPFRTEEEVVALRQCVALRPVGVAVDAEPGAGAPLAERLECGTVWVNCWLLRDLRTPFGGVKQSGVGREGGDEALRFFTEPKTVCLRVSPQ